jgi:hypothetical protein
MINPAFRGYGYAPPVSNPSYGNSQVQGGHSPYAPAQPNAQFTFILQGMMTALQQLSMGWQGLMAPNVAPMNNQYGGQNHTPYGPVRPNPQPFSLLPSGQGSYVNQVSHNSQYQFGGYGPIAPNPQPFSLLPAGQGSYVSQVSHNSQYQFGGYGPVRPNPQPFSLLPAGYGSF